MKRQKRFDVKFEYGHVADLWFDSLRMFRIVVIPTFFIWKQNIPKCFSFGFVWIRWMAWVDIWDERESE